MQKSSKLLNILMLCSLIAIIYAVFIILINNQNIQQIWQRQYIQYFNKDNDENAAIAENMLELEKQNADLKKQLAIYEIEIADLKHQHKKAALAIIDDYRKLLRELLTLNCLLHLSQDYGKIIANIRSNVKNQHYNDSNIDNDLTILEQFNEKFIKHQLINQPIRPKWLNGLFKNWFTIEQLDTSTEEYKQFKSKALQAITNINHCISSENFLQTYIGI